MSTRFSWLDPLFWPDLVEDAMEEISDMRELMRRMRLQQPGLKKAISRKARKVRVEVTPLSTGSNPPALGSVSMWFELPLRIQGLANRRENRYVKAGREGDHRALAKNAMRSCLNGLRIAVAPKYEVVLTRLIAPRGRFLDAHDNLRDGFKSIVDGIAEALGVNDGDTTKVKWDYLQEHAANWGVRVDIKAKVVEDTK